MYPPTPLGITRRVRCILPSCCPTVEIPHSPPEHPYHHGVEMPIRLYMFALPGSGRLVPAVSLSHSAGKASHPCRPQQDVQGASIPHGGTQIPVFAAKLCSSGSEGSPLGPKLCTFDAKMPPHGCQKCSRAPPIVTRSGIIAEYQILNQNDQFAPPPWIPQKVFQSYPFLVPNLRYPK